MKRIVLISNQMALMLFLISQVAIATSMGSPPIKNIEIPISENEQFFDMVYDNYKSIYVGHTSGVKIFNGSTWSNVITGPETVIRRLHFDGIDRVYFGGTGILGYVHKNEFGGYEYKNITPKQYINKFSETWNVFECNNDIVFSGLYNVFIYDRDSDSVKSWDFSNKLGSGYCYQNKLIYQDRKNGLIELINENWQESSIELNTNSPISKFQKLNEDTYLIVSKNENWRIINNNEVIHLPFTNELPSLNQYFATESLDEGNVILGSSNGLLHFVNINSKQYHSFQLTNEWISRILKFDDGLLILGEFEIYFIQWPSAIKIQGKETGLASNIYDSIYWNNQHYVASSAGVFLEGKQINSQGEKYRKTNWTNGEAWSFLPINDKEILLSESHKLYLIDQKSHELSIQPLSDTIYPREVIQSRFNPDRFFVITEFDLQLLMYHEEGWQLKPIFDKRAVSIVDDNSDSILLTDYNADLFRVKLDLILGQTINVEKLNDNYQIDTINNEIMALILTNQNTLIAYNSHAIYEIKEGSPPIELFKELHPLIDDQSLSGFFQDDNGLFYGFTPFRIFYQDDLKKWIVVDVSQHIKGYIGNIKINENKIKILSNGKIISYSKNLKREEKLSQYSLRMTEILKKENNNEAVLSLNPEKQITLNFEDNASLDFSFVLNDIKNQESNLYRYKLNGDKTDWSDFTKNSRIQVRDLNAGKYKLNIQAMDSDGKLYEMPSYNFIVNPPWYLTGLAKLSWALLLIAIIYSIVYLLIKRRETVHETQKQELKNIINEKTKELQIANKNLQEIAHLDGLTGLSNRYYLDEHINRIALEPRKSISVIMMDMDDFKKFNDTNGHIAGDELLKKMASYLQSTFNRSTDIVARYGGEEFVVILLDRELDYAIEKANKVLEHLDNKRKQTSVSIGVCHSSNQIELKSLDAIYHLIDKADQALYNAKNSGKNRVNICH